MSRQWGLAKVLRGVRRAVQVFLLLAGVIMSHNASAEPEGGVTVVLFSQPYCINCEVIKRYFTEKKVVFQEFDIVESVVAREYFEKFGGRGTPLVVVGKEVMHTFDPDRFWRLYRQTPEGIDPS